MSPVALLTRPRPDSENLATLLRACGVDSLIDPIINILPLEGAELPPLEKVQALLLTSANGVRALAALLGPEAKAHNKPLLAVGTATAEAARAAGFRHVQSAGGDVGALAALAIERLKPTDGPLLHIAGTRVAGDLAARLGAHGFEVQRECLYRAEASTALSAEARETLENGKIDMVLFFSPRSARGFVKLICAADSSEPLAQVTAICLSPAVAGEAAGLAWRRIRTAILPEQTALLDEVAREIKIAD